MEIKNLEIAFMDKCIIASGYSHTTELPTRTEPTENDIRRANRQCNMGGGHNNWMKGVRVIFDFKFEQYLTPQMQRYNWIDFVNSQSKMIKLVAFKDISKNYNEFVLQPVIDLVNTLIDAYNNFDFEAHNFFVHGKVIKTKKALFRYLISNLPLGFQLWAKISTNYLQLRNIYAQRKIHKLPEWREFCKVLETLPNSHFITKPAKVPKKKAAPKLPLTDLNKMFAGGRTYLEMLHGLCVSQRETDLVTDLAHNPAKDVIDRLPYLVIRTLQNLNFNV